MSKKYLILGKHGQLARAFQNVLDDRTFVALGSDELDITDEDEVVSAVMKVQPDVIINTAAYTNVERAEIEEEKACQVNAYAVGKLAKLCRDFGIILVHFSTDYVFDGRKNSGYKEDEIGSPINAYGRSKALGEQLLLDEMESELDLVDQDEGKYFIVRTSYLFEAGHENLVQKIWDKVKLGKPFQVVEDQLACLTYAQDLAGQVKWLIESNEYESGVYHITNSGKLNWVDLAKKLNEFVSGDKQTIIPCSLHDWPAKVQRPQHSVLINTKLPALRNWQDAVEEYVKLIRK